MKGLSGKIIAAVISLIIALLALAILFGIIGNLKPMILNFLESMIKGLKQKLCELRPWPFSLLPC